MTLPPDDDRLVAFLRRHRPDPPPESPDLEDQIMAAISQDRRVARVARRDRPLRYRRWAASALAASALLAWGGWASWQTSVQRAAELQEVEDFLADTWYGGVYGDETYRIALDTTQSDWLFSVYATPY